MNKDLTRTGQPALSRYIEAARASGTMRAYQRAQTAFVEFAGPELPADVESIGRYLADLGERCAPSTVRLHAAAIAALHTDAGMTNPVDHPAIARLLSGHARAKRHLPTQATPLTAQDFEAISATASTPRRGRSGHLETEKTANERGLLDVALIGTMRDALLRRSEAAALTWDDLKLEVDNTGRLRIRQSKTDPEGRGHIAFLSADITHCLMVIQATHPERHSVFGLSASQICRRIAAAARAAGLGPGYSGHSPRVGMAMDLARAGLGLVELQQAGRWKSPDMPAYYVRSIRAGDNAVAKWYAMLENEGRTH